MDATVSTAFRYYVSCIGSFEAKERVRFQDAQELQASMKYYFEQAASNMRLARNYAKRAEQLRYVIPVNEKRGSCSNLRKALIIEARNQMRNISTILASKCDIDASIAKGTYKFFGELFNVGTIYADVLLREIKVLASMINRSSLAHECLDLLIQTVADKIYETSYDGSSTMQQLIESIQNPEYSQVTAPVNQDNLHDFVSNLRSSIRSEADAEAIIKTILEQSTTDFDGIPVTADLIRQLTEVQLNSESTSQPIMFADFIEEFFIAQFYKTSALRARNDITEIRMTCLILMASELFRSNLISFKVLNMWLRHRHLQQVPSAVLCQVNANITSRQEPLEEGTLTMLIKLMNAAIDQIN